MVGMSLVLAGIAACHVLRANLKFDIAVRITADDKFAVYPEYHFYKTIEISRHGRVNGATPLQALFDRRCGGILSAAQIPKLTLDIGNDDYARKLRLQKANIRPAL